MFTILICNSKILLSFLKPVLSLSVFWISKFTTLNYKIY